MIREVSSSSHETTIKRISLASIAWLMIASTVCFAQQMSISPHGTQIKTIDSGIAFTCTLDANNPDDSSPPPPAAAAKASTIKWLAPGRKEITANSGRVYIERMDRWNLRLYITRIQESDSGIYTCEAESEIRGSRRWIAEEARLFLYEDIVFANTSTEVRSLKGSDALLRCIVTGQPRPEVTWRFNRQKINPDGVKYAVDEEGLRIKILDLEDEGSYECRAEVDSHGNVKIRNINLEVIYAPVIIQAPTAEVVIKGHDTSLECRANANPPPTYQWFKEQQMSDMYRVKVRLTSGSSTYVIRDVGSSDEGRYFCRVSNYLGTREAFVDIRMLVPPVIGKLPEKLSVAEGKSLNISCEATGVPVPKITWKLQPTTQTQESSSSPVHGGWTERTQPGKSVLTMHNVARSHAGLLSCTGNSIAGTDSKELEVTVEYAPSIEVPLTEQLGWAGQTRDFSCIGRGVPLPSINWFRGEQYITDNNVYQLTTTKTNDAITSVLTVTISESVAWAYGGYSCIAKNVHGYVAKEIRLTEATPPDAVRNVSVEKETSSSVTLTATAPARTGGLPLTSWLLTYEAESDPDAKPTSLVFHFGDRLHVANLSAGTSYTFYLSAANAVGRSQPVKFRVTTARKSALKEQSDVPERDGNTSFSDSLSSSLEEKSRNKKPKDRNRTNTSSSSSSSSSFDYDDSEVDRSQLGSSSSSSGGTGEGARATDDGVLLAIAIGSTVVLTAIVAALVFALWWQKRHKTMRPQWYASSAAGLSSGGLATPQGGVGVVSYRSMDSTTAPAGGEFCLGRPAAENYIMLLPTARQPTDPLPAVVALVDPQMTSSHETTEMVVTSEYLQRMNSTMTLPMVKSRTVNGMAGGSGGGGGVGSPRETTRFMTLQRCDSGRVAMTTAAHEDPPGVVTLAQPVPIVMLQPLGGGAGVAVAGQTGVKPEQVGGKTVQAGGVKGRPAGGVKSGKTGGANPPTLFIDEILDGYHSGDNVDDDIDDVDFTIKTPSFHRQIN